MRAIAVILLLFTQLPGIAVAQLSINKSVIELSRDETRSLLRLSNTGKDTLYLNLELGEITDPAESDTTEVSLTDPARAGIIVHPRQMVLAPGQTRSARVVIQNSVITSRDRVFRLQVSPHAGDALISGSGEVNAGVRMLIGYQLLLLVRPDRLQPDVAVERTGDELRIVNSGNTNVLLRKLDVCRADGEVCTGIKPNRLYAGESLALPLPDGVDVADALVRTRQFTRSTEKLVEYEPDQ